MISVKSILTCVWLWLGAFFMCGILEKKTKKTEQDKKNISGDTEARNTR